MRLVSCGFGRHPACHATTPNATTVAPLRLEAEERVSFFSMHPAVRGPLVVTAVTRRSTGRVFVEVPNPQVGHGSAGGPTPRQLGTSVVFVVRSIDDGSVGGARSPLVGRPAPYDASTRRSARITALYLSTALRPAGFRTRVTICAAGSCRGRSPRSGVDGPDASPGTARFPSAAGADATAPSVVSVIPPPFGWSAATNGSRTQAPARARGPGTATPRKGTGAAFAGATCPPVSSTRSTAPSPRAGPGLVPGTTTAARNGRARRDAATEPAGSPRLASA